MEIDAQLAQVGDLEQINRRIDDVAHDGVLFHDRAGHWRYDLDARAQSASCSWPADFP